MSMLLAMTLILFPVLMAYAAFSDLFTMTISNMVSVALIVIFLGVALGSGIPAYDILVNHLLAGLATLVLTFIFFARGWIGGGDAKLAAATAVWLGWSNLVAYGVEASFLGFGLTVGILLMRKLVLPPRLMAQEWIARLHAHGNGVPYGIALAIAGLLTYPDTAVWQAFVVA